MLLDYITAELLLILLITIAVISILVSMVYYLRVLHDKNLAEFFNNFIRFYGKAALRNTFDNRRKAYLKINNICLIVFWLSFLLILIVKFN